MLLSAKLITLLGKIVTASRRMRGVAGTGGAFTQLIKLFSSNGSTLRSDRALAAKNASSIIAMKMFKTAYMKSMMNE